MSVHILFIYILILYPSTLNRNSKQCTQCSLSLFSPKLLCEVDSADWPKITQAVSAGASELAPCASPLCPNCYITLAIFGEVFFPLDLICYCLYAKVPESLSRSQQRILSIIMKVTFQSYLQSCSCQSITILELD